MQRQRRDDARRTGARRRSPGACATRIASRSTRTPRVASTSTTSARALREEIDAGTAGADYGWNVREGTCANPALGPANCGSAPPAGMTNPIFDYGRGDGCVSITGGAFVPNGDRVAGRVPRQIRLLGLWLRQDLPPRPERAGLHASRLRDRPRREQRGPPGIRPVRVDAGALLHDLRRWRAGPADQLHRPEHAAQRRDLGQPVRRARHHSPSPSTGAAAPTLIRATRSRAMSGRSATGPPSSTRAHPGIAHVRRRHFTASLRVTDNRGAVSSPATVTISSAIRARPRRSVPSGRRPRSRSASVTVTGSGSDAQDPSVALSWTVLRRHDTHTHPWASGTGSSITFPYPAPEDLSAVDNSWIEVHLTATDSGGLTDTASRRYLPRKVRLTLASSPAAARA